MAKAKKTSPAQEVDRGLRMYERDKARRKRSASAHTPGPWFVSRSENPDVYRGQSHLMIVDEATHTCVADVETKINAEANARLIAAAPDMFAALQIAASVIRIAQICETPESGEFQNFNWTLQVIHAVLNKAYGNAA